MPHGPAWLGCADGRLIGPLSWLQRRALSQVLPVPDSRIGFMYAIT
jgi:hypothetical protein